MGVSGLVIQSRLTILTINLCNDRVNATALDQVLEETRPNVVAAQELGPAAARVLERHFSHGYLRPQSDYDGMGLATNFDVEAEEMDTPAPRAIAANVAGDKGVGSAFAGLLLTSVRLPPPLTRAWFRTRSRYTEILIEHSESHRGPLCMLGDLNATPWWPVYLILTDGLQDGARHRRRMVFPGGATWPAVFPILRIDHILTRGLTASRVVPIRVAVPITEVCWPM
jgi:vancomycin resistance protein VanJ